MTDPTPDRGQETSVSLLHRARANDPDAWRRLVFLYRPLVLFWAGRDGLAGADAEDVAQDVFRAAAGGLAGFRRDRPGDTFRGWLRVIARRRVLAHQAAAARQPRAAGGSVALRRLQAVPAADDPADDPPAEVGALYRRAVELVKGEFEDRTWQMFWRVTADGSRPAEVATELGVTPAAVRQARSRVLRRLKEEVGDLEPDAAE